MTSGSQSGSPNSRPYRCARSPPCPSATGPAAISTATSRKKCSNPAGVMISIGSDAHNLAGLANVEFGVGIARKGGLGPDDILNCRSAEDFLAFARARRP